MSHIHLVDLARENDAGVTVTRHREQDAPAANDPVNESAREEARKQRAKEEFERATTPFPS